MMQEKNLLSPGYNGFQSVDNFFLKMIGENVESTFFFTGIHSVR